MAFVGCLAILAAAAGFGHRLLGLVFPRNETSPERAIFGIGIGLGILAYVVYGLGLVSVLTQPVLWAAVIIPLGVFSADIGAIIRLSLDGVRSLLAVLIGRWGWFYAAISWMMLLNIILNLIGALAPEIIFDAIWYHLTMPKYYLAAHKVYYIKQLTYGAFPRTIEMLYALAMAIGQEAAVKLMHFAFGLLIVITIFIFGRRYLSKQGAFLAGAIFYMMSNVNMLSATAYIDLGLVFFEFLAAISLIIWAEARRPAWAVMTGVFLGLALGSKHQAMLLIPVVGILIIAAWIKQEKRSLKSIILPLAMVFIPALAIALPWYVDAYLNTRNPVYPLFNELFGTGESFERAMFAGTAKKSWYDGHSLLDVVTLPWKLTRGEFEGWLSPLIIISLPLLMLLKRWPAYLRSWLAFSGLFYLAYFAIIPFYTMRYFLPVVPVLSLVAAMLYSEAMKADRWLRAVSMLAIIIVFAGNLGFVAIKNLPSAKASFGWQDRESYLNETLGWYEVNAYLRDEGEKQTVKVLVNGAPFFYYFEFPFEYGTGPGGDTVKERYGRLRRTGFTHMMILVGELTDPQELKEVKLVFQAEQPANARSNAARSVRLYEIR